MTAPSDPPHAGPRQARNTDTPPGLMQRRAPVGPQRRAGVFVVWASALLIVAGGVLVTMLIAWAYSYSLQHGSSVEFARTVAVVAAATAGATVTAALTRPHSVGGWLVPLAMLGIAYGLVQVPWFGERLSLEPLPGGSWLLVLAGGGLAVAGAALMAWSAARWKGAIGATDVRSTAGASVRRSEPRANAPPLTRYAWLSVLTAVATMALKSAAYVLTGSVALLSDAAESLVNLAGAGLAVVILAIAARPADASHPFGHGRAEYFSSGFTGALILIAAAAILWTAGERLADPLPLAHLDSGLIIAMVATGANLAVARLLLRAGRRYDSITLEADGRHLMTDVWTTGAVLAGLGGVTLTGWLWLDPVIAILAALNIVWAGAQLVVRSLSGLLGSAIPASERAEVERILDRYRRQGVQFHDLRTHAAGAQRLITVHVLVPGTVTVKQGHDLVQAIEADLDAALPNLFIITHLEPLEDPASFAHAIVSADRKASAAASPTFGVPDDGRGGLVTGSGEPSAGRQNRRANGPGA